MRDPKVFLDRGRLLPDGPLFSKSATTQGRSRSDVAFSSDTGVETVERRAWVLLLMSEDHGSRRSLPPFFIPADAARLDRLGVIPYSLFCPRRSYGMCGWMCGWKK